MAPWSTRIFTYRLFLRVRRTNPAPPHPAGNFLDIPLRGRGEHFLILKFESSTLSKNGPDPQGWDYQLVGAIICFYSLYTFH